MADRPIPHWVVTSSDFLTSNVFGARISNADHQELEKTTSGAFITPGDLFSCLVCQTSILDGPILRFWCENHPSVPINDRVKLQAAAKHMMCEECMRATITSKFKDRTTDVSEFIAHGYSAIKCPICQFVDVNHGPLRSLAIEHREAVDDMRTALVTVRFEPPQLKAMDRKYIRAMTDVSLTMMRDMVVIQCPNSGCTFKGTRKEMETHIKQCPLQMVTCESADGIGCGAVLPVTKFPEHQTTCPAVQAPCPLCHEWYFVSPLHRSNMTEHMSRCPQTKIHCLYKPHGCKRVFTLESVGYGEESVYTTHLRKCRFRREVCDYCHSVRDAHGIHDATGCPAAFVCSRCHGPYNGITPHVCVQAKTCGSCNVTYLTKHEELHYQTCVKPRTLIDFETPQNPPKVFDGPFAEAVEAVEEELHMNKGMRILIDRLSDEYHKSEETEQKRSDTIIANARKRQREECLHEQSETKVPRVHDAVEDIGSDSSLASGNKCN